MPQRLDFAQWDLVNVPIGRKKLGIIDVTTASGGNAGTGFTTTPAVGTNIVGILGNNGLSLGVPPYLTTALGTNASSAFAGTGTSATNASITLNTAGLAISVAPPAGGGAGTGFTSASTAGVNIVGTLDTNGLSVGVPAYLTTAQAPGAYLTTAMQSDASSAFAGTGATIAGGSMTVNTAGVNISLPAYLTTAMASNEAHVVSLNGSSGQLSIVGSGLNSISNNNSSIVVSARSESLNEIQDPTIDKVFHMASNQVQFEYAIGGAWTTNATRQGLFEIDVQGNVTQEADAMHIHQHAGVPTIMDMIHVEAEGTNVTGLRLNMSASVAAEINQPIKFTTEYTNYPIGSVPMILGTQMSNSVANLNAQYLQGALSSQFAGTGTTAVNASVTLNSNGLNISVNPPGGGGAGTGFTTASTAGANIVGTLSTNGLSMGVPAYLTTYVNDLTSGRAGVGETVGTTAGTDLALTVDTNGVSIGYPKWLTTAAATNVTSDRAGTGTSATNILVTLNTNGIALSYDNANDAGTGFTSATTAGTEIKATLATNGLSMGVPAYLTAAGGAVTASYYGNLPSLNDMVTGASAITQTSGSSIFVQPFFLPYPVSIGFVRFFASFNDSAVGTAGTTQANTTFSCKRFTTYGVVVYSQGAGASSRSIQSVTSSSGGFTGMTQYGAAAQASRYTITLEKTYPVSGGTSQYTTQYAVSSGSIVVSSNSNTLFTGPRFLDVPFGVSLPAGNYWLGLGASASSASQSSNISFCGTAALALSINGVSQTNLSVGALGVATLASDNQMQIGLGVWSTNASNWSTGSIGVNSVSQVVSNPQMPFWFIRQA